MIHSLYPDCLDKAMDDEDPRKNFLDASKQTKLANYAFPLGFLPKFGPDRPQHKLLPMDMHAANDNSYIQYLIFYEDLQFQHYEAYKLMKYAQEEIDEYFVDVEKDGPRSQGSSSSDEEDK